MEENVKSYLDLPEKCGECPCRKYAPIQQYYCQLIDRQLGRPYEEDRPDWCPLRNVTPDGWQTGIPTEGRVFLAHKTDGTYGTLIVDSSRPDYETQFADVLEWQLLA